MFASKTIARKSFARSLPPAFSLEERRRCTTSHGLGLRNRDFTYSTEAIQVRERKRGTAIDWHFDDLNLGGALNLASGTNAALTFIKANPGETYLMVNVRCIEW